MNAPLWLGISFAILGCTNIARSQDWSRALAQMPLGTNITWLTHSNCAQVCFAALREDPVVKGLVFLPGATDELYFFRRVNAQLTPVAPTLRDAIVALTNQTPLRVSFRAPLVLIHSEEDVLELEFTVPHAATAQALKGKTVPGRQEFWDRDWKVMRAHLQQALSVRVFPYNRQSAARHFYRHTFAGWNLTGWETLEATALAGKSRFHVKRHEVEFTLDERVVANPRLEAFPR
jgi:hypothetical protein